MKILKCKLYGLHAEGIIEIPSIRFLFRSRFSDETGDKLNFVTGLELEQGEEYDELIIIQSADEERFLELTGIA